MPKSSALETFCRELSEDVRIVRYWHPLGCRANRAWKTAPGGCDNVIHNNTRSYTVRWEGGTHTLCRKTSPERKKSSGLCTQYGMSVARDSFSRIFATIVNWCTLGEWWAASIFLGTSAGWVVMLFKKYRSVGCCYSDPGRGQSLFFFGAVHKLENSHSLVTRYIWYKIKKTSAVRSRISSKLVFASCVGYFDRAYYGFYVTSSRMLVLVICMYLSIVWTGMISCCARVVQLLAMLLFGHYYARP